METIFHGAVKDLDDTRDYLIASYISEIDIPKFLDLSNKFSKVRNQGPEGTCVAFATTSVKESQEVNGVYLSPRFIYDRVGLPTGGAYLRDAMKVLTEVGVCPEECQPYTPNLKNQPTSDALDRAKPNKIKGYARLNIISEMKLCLVQNGCFAISVKVTDKWTNPINGVIEEGGNFIGGHAITFVGYDDSTKLVKFRNSWGENWGVNGYGYMTYDYLMNNLLDAWSSVDIPESEEEIYVAPKKSFIDKIKEFFSSKPPTTLFGIGFATIVFIIMIVLLINKFIS